MTVSEWVRQSLRRARRAEPLVDAGRKLEVVQAGAVHEFPVADIEQLLRGVEEESIRNLDTVKSWMKSYQKPVVFSAWATDEVKDGELYKKLQHDQLLPYPTPDRAAKALARLVEYSEYLGVAGGNA